MIVAGAVMDKDRKKRNEEVMWEPGLHDAHRVLSLRDRKVADTDSVGHLFHMSVYGYGDLSLHEEATPKSTYLHSLNSIDRLLERDSLREKDGFPKKIRMGKLIKPDKAGKDRVILVPTTVEEKFIHDRRRQADQEQASGGSGEGQEGDVIGEEPVHTTGGAEPDGAGQGEGGEHEIESSAYDLGRILTEKFHLPNLTDKGKKRSLSRYTYDLTDRHTGFGQILDKKATLKKIIETNIGLEKIRENDEVDTASLLVSPQDEVYRILSKEQDYESQAVVFFIRDYSGSMNRRPTDIVVNQHVLIYSWLMYQYERNVETRFILHDTAAKEVPDFYTYYSSSVAGGTRVVSAYALVNDIVEQESLARDYNVYVFHGTDGDDWDKDGKEAVPELVKMLAYSNRIGITIADNPSRPVHSSTVEQYIKKSKLLEDYPKKIRLDAVREDPNEERLIEGIKNLISE